MSKRPGIDRFALRLDSDVHASVLKACISTTERRQAALPRLFTSPAEARAAAAQIKDFVIDNLGALLVQFEAAAQRNGIKVHWAKDAVSARKIILDIAKSGHPGATIAKAKSMATEEIHLNEALEEAGFEVVETDLGEFVVQIDHDKPSHIVAPIIHKSRFDVAKSFEREGIGTYTEEPTELTMQAREHLRGKFKQAQIGISGVNFAISETGRIVLVENEGNNRYSTTAPDLHIAVMGIEKLLPSEQHLPLFLQLLSGSATGQSTTVYTHMISGPRKADESDGPSEVHVVLLDNGRSAIARGPYRRILRCIRCGACLNVCPVYRQSSGHGYRHVYSGPVGAVLAPLLGGIAEYGDLPKASSLCGACEEACPVQIPIPDMLLMLRDKVTQEGLKSPIPWRWFGLGASDSMLWRAGLTMLPLASKLPNPMAANWAESRELPERVGPSFRRWWNERS